MQRVLYMANFSPPVRAVLLAAKALDIELKHKFVDFSKGDNLDPQFVKLNPQHTIPTLVDNEEVIWDSHAINAYLVRKYAKDDSLYPKNPIKRAIVDQRLHFDSGIVFPILRRTVRGLRNKKFTTIPAESIEAACEAYEFLEKFLDGHPWIAGDNITIADFNLIATVTSLMIIAPLNEMKYPKVSAWIKRAENLPYYGSENLTGLENLKELVNFLLKN